MSQISTTPSDSGSPNGSIRLIALDLDGTLMQDDMVIRSARVRRAVAAAQQRGVVVTLATGRSLDHTLPYAAELGVTAPLICYQGGLIQGPGSGQPLYRATMPSALMRGVLAHRIRLGWHVAMYATTRVFVDEQRYETTFYHDMLGRQVTWVGDLARALQQVTPAKFIILAEPAAVVQVLAQAQELFAGRLEITRSHARIVEGNPRGVSKGDALSRLASLLGIERHQVMAVGDQDNDLKMVSWAGVGVAMGNATAAVKAAADWVAPCVAEDGAAAAIERFVLASTG